MPEKAPLTMDEIAAQNVVELPERELPALVTVTCLAVCVGSIQITVRNVHVAAAICAAVQAITALTGASVRCTVSA